MKVISPTYRINNNYQIATNNNPDKGHNQSVTFQSFTGSKFMSYGDSLVYMWQVDKLKKETQEFPNDIKYREQLLVNAGLPPQNQHKLRSIVGPDEIKSIMLDFDSKPNVFEYGEKGVNVIQNKMRANLHMHTTASDGSLTVQELLDKASEYADTVKRNNPNIKTPFVVAITDHDTTDGTKEAIKIISEKPLKYKNLRVILGVEMTTFNNVATNIVNAPTNTHVLVYGIDPNEPRFENFINITKAKKNELQYKITKTANDIHNKHFKTVDFYNVKEAKHQYNPLNKNIIGIYNGMEAYFEVKTAVEHIVLKDEVIISELKKHNAPTTTKELMEKLSEFHTPTDGNNKIKGALDTLPEFISATTDLTKEDISKKLETGLNEPGIKSYMSELKSGISKYKTTLTPKMHYMPTFEILYYNLSQQKNVSMGLAHPIDTIKNITENKTKYKFLTELYSKFKSECKEKAIFSEAYYQSYKPGRKEFNESPKTQKFLKTLSRAFKLLRTGSADTHGLNIFVR